LIFYGHIILPICIPLSLDGTMIVVYHGLSIQLTRINMTHVNFNLSWLIFFKLYKIMIGDLRSVYFLRFFSFVDPVLRDLSCENESVVSMSPTNLHFGLPNIVQTSLDYLKWLSKVLSTFRVFSLLMVQSYGTVIICMLTQVSFDWFSSTLSLIKCFVKQVISSEWFLLQH
jgi:hypothetical protein